MLSVHRDRSVSLYSIADLAKCVRDSKKPIYPKLVYVATSSEHFPTESGRFEESLLEMDVDYECRQHAVSTARQTEERDVLQGLMPIVDDTNELQARSGDLHVGGRECVPCCCCSQLFLIFMLIEVSLSCSFLTLLLTVLAVASTGPCQASLTSWLLRLFGN